MKEIKFYIQYLAYSAKKPIPKALKYLYAEDNLYSLTVIDSHNVKRNIEVYGKTIDEAKDIAARIIEDYFPAVQIMEVI